MPNHGPESCVPGSSNKWGIETAIVNVAGIVHSTSTRVATRCWRSAAEPAQVNCDHCHHTSQVISDQRAAPRIVRS